MSNRRAFCDGITRRDALRVGFGGLSAASLAITGASNFSSLAAGEQVAAQKTAGKPVAAGDVSLIILFLKGGLSTIDTLDMKPNAPTEFRGEFRPIPTALPGVQICEHLPRLAKTLDQCSMIRSFTHRNSDHGPADHYMITGYHPTPAFNPNLRPNNERPSHGAIIARKLGPRGAVPAYVCVPKMHASAGSAYLGPNAAPFVVEADPSSPDFSVPDLVPPLEINPNRIDHRRALLAQVDRYRKSVEVRANRQANMVNRFQARAFELASSAETRKAFDITQEPDKLRDQYGRHSLGQSVLMARRLVESGVRCVMIDHNNWDTHQNNFHILKNNLLPQLDSGLPTLLRDLADRGLSSRTLVAVFGEFGRTPRVNSQAGRDHWGPANTILLCGGGIQNGRVIGATNARGERPLADPIGPEDLSATMFRCLGIDAEEEFHTPEGRPMKIANNGRVVNELF